MIIAVFTTPLSLMRLFAHYSLQFVVDSLCEMYYNFPDLLGDIKALSKHNVGFSLT